MKRFLTIAAVVLFASSAMAQGTYSYGWTLSNSAADPFVNTGTPTMGVVSIYLWYQCSLEDGMSAAEFDLAGTISVFAFTAMNGFLNAGGATNLQLAVGGCPLGPIFAGTVLIMDAPGNLGLVPSINSFNVTVDCGTAGFLTHDNNWIGYASDGGAVPGSGQAAGELCTVSVEDSSWGTIKSLYR